MRRKLPGRRFYYRHDRGAEGGAVGAGGAARARGGGQRPAEADAADPPRAEKRRASRRNAERGDPERGKAERPKKHTVLTALIQELFGMLRRSSQLSDVELRRELGDLHADFGRAMLADDYEDLLRRVRELPLSTHLPEERPEPADAGMVDTASFFELLGLLHALGEALRLPVVSGDIERLSTSAFVARGRRVSATLLRALEESTAEAQRLSLATDVLRECVAEVVIALSQLAQRNGDATRLQSILMRLEEAADLDELERLRAVLVSSVHEVVESAAAQRNAAQQALSRVEKSMRRATELEAALDGAERKARTDPLTSLGNRFALAEWVERFSSGARPTGVLILDLDHFKRINERYGHRGGDRVLRHIGRFLSRELRGDDQAFRYGGEEFVVLLGNSDWAGARATAERLRKRVHGEAVPGPEPIAVTVSVGVCVWEPGQRFEVALQAADDALYRAKAGGRNRVVG